MSVYYNDNDKFAVQWLKNLIAAGELPAGDVDDRPIQEVRAGDIAGYSRHHFFAGIGGWELALKWAGWPEGREVWTGSCPCQPVSSAGQRQGHADKRHLWPTFFELISELRPAVVFGEQVASIDGREWVAAVRADLESDGYACGIADLPAAGVGAPHIRHRLWWVADSNGATGQPDAGTVHENEEQARCQDSHEPARSGEDGGLENPEGERLSRRDAGENDRQGMVRRLERPSADSDDGLADAEGTGPAGRRQGADDGTRDGAERCRGLGDTDSGRSQAGSEAAATARQGSAVDTTDRDDAGRLGDTEDQQGIRESRQIGGREIETGGPGSGNVADTERDGRIEGTQEIQAGQPILSWDGLEFIPCADGKARPVKPGIFPLADGIPGRVGMLRGYGNAIVPQVGAVFIRAFMETDNA